MQYQLPELEAARLVLRPMEIEDVSDLMAVYGDEEVMKANSTEPVIKTIDELLAYLTKYDLSWDTHQVPPTMVLELKKTGKVIGIIHFFSLFQENAELGYLLAKDYWRQGYMSEALDKMLEAGFELLHFHRIELQYDPNHIASAKLAKNHGFVVEGTLRSVIKLNDGKYHDLVISSILQVDYNKRRKQK